MLIARKGVLLRGDDKLLSLYLTGATVFLDRQGLNYIVDIAWIPLQNRREFGRWKGAHESRNH